MNFYDLNAERRAREYERSQRMKRNELIAAGVLALVIVLGAIAFRVGCASVCESRGGRVVWTSSGEVVCLEPGP